jgi:hypothetical protein
MVRQSHTFNSPEAPLALISGALFCDFVIVVVEIGSQELCPWGWLQTTVLLISASLVARITDVSLEHPALYVYFWA